ncbi:MAG TPA: hypothetical protein VJ692_02675 [Nitrospiraceae bacterium]|nr:hypothetical protein [Nitrospiraceae bacterium]
MRVLTPICVFSVLLISGCSRLLQPAHHDKATSFERRCSPPAIHRGVSLTALDNPVGESGAATAQLPNPDAFSPRALDAAYAIQALPLLKDINALEQQGEGHALALLKAREKLIGRILLAMEEVSSLTAEVDCEADRADQIADHLHDELSTRTKYQTLGAIVVAGVAAVASGGFILAAGLSVAEATAVIAGGSLAAGLGTLPLFAESQQEYTHPRNLLRDVWEGPRMSALFPTSVWRYLAHQNKAELEGNTYRAELIESWRQEGRLGEPGSAIEHKRIPLLFGDGGIYELQDLRARSTMLRLLASTVEMMHQDLETLIRQVLIQEALME